MMWLLLFSVTFSVVCVLAHAVNIDSSTSRGQCTPEFVLSDDPYELLGVPRDASDVLIIKHYRALARKWHPDKKRHVSGTSSCKAAETETEVVPVTATQAFAAIGVAYGILSDPEKRDVYDRLGLLGLRRLQDGDPRVKRDYLPPDEVLRRHLSKNDPPLSFMDWLICSIFAWLEGKASYD